MRNFVWKMAPRTVRPQPEQVTMEETKIPRPKTPNLDQQKKSPGFVLEDSKPAVSAKDEIPEAKQQTFAFRERKQSHQKRRHQTWINERRWWNVAGSWKHKHKDG